MMGKIVNAQLEQSILKKTCVQMQEVHAYPMRIAVIIILNSNAGTFELIVMNVSAQFQENPPNVSNHLPVKKRRVYVHFNVKNQNRK